MTRGIVKVLSMMGLVALSACNMGSLEPGEVEELGLSESSLSFGDNLDWDTMICGSLEQILEPAHPYVTSSSFKVYPRVYNESDHDFNGPIGVYVSSNVGPTRYAGGLSSLCAGCTRYVFPDRPLVHEPLRFLEWGHRTANPGECQSELLIRVDLTLDPDLFMDGDPDNDDCLKDNTKTYRYPYMAACPQ